MPKRIAAISLVVLVIAFVIISFRRPGGSERVVTVAGSTTILPVAQAASELFNERNPDIRVLVQGGGSSAGIEAVSIGTAQIGMASRELEPDEEELGLVDIPIAVDAIAVVVNPDNPISEMTTGVVRRIFAGEIASWRSLGWKDEPILLVNRDEASGTREAFAKLVMDGRDFAKAAVIQPGSGQVRAIVASAEPAVGYMSLGYVTREVKPIAIDGVSPSVETIREGRYRIRRTLHFFTKGRPTGPAKEFIDFVLGPEVQREIVGSAFLPVSEMR